MICVSVDAVDFEFCESVLRKHQLIEFRLERSSLSINEIKELFAMPKKMIAVCRSTRYDNPKRLKILSTAIDAGAMFVDIDFNEDNDFLNSIKTVSEKSFCKLIISYHNYDNTPCYDDLKKIADDCFILGADIVKIACQANHIQDCISLISLYKEYEPGKLITIGMDSIGKITRIAAPLLGAPFTYASLEREIETAPGQIDLISMKKIYELMK